MKPPCYRPVLLVEGDGDKQAVPELIRRTLQFLGIYDIYPASRPIKVGDAPKLRRAGELEKFLTYASTRIDGDSVLLVLDCDDDCPLHLTREFQQRARSVFRQFGKPIGIGFIAHEFESLFLHCLPSLSIRLQEYDWDIGALQQLHDVESIRDCKAF